jgi:hypothetical protein
MAGNQIRITHRDSGALFAQGPGGWGITPFEGNCYISNKYLQTDGFRPNYVPGLCPYKFLSVWMDLDFGEKGKVKNLVWMYWLPNPLFPFIWYRVGIPAGHPGLIIEKVSESG